MISLRYLQIFIKNSFLHGQILSFLLKLKRKHFETVSDLQEVAKLLELLHTRHPDTTLLTQCVVKTKIGFGTLLTKLQALFGFYQSYFSF